MQALFSKVRRRLRWYKGRFQVNNPIVGRAVEWLGNTVRMDGLIYSVDTPQLTRGHKSTLAFGLHEMEERELIRRWLPPHLPVLEFGGGLGVVPCLTNRRLTHPDRHLVVEANPAMIPILERNRDLNACKFSVINRAIAYDCEQIELNVDSEFVGSTAKDVFFGKSVSVATTTVRQLMGLTGFAEAGIVADIEGAEADVIERELPQLGDRIRFLMVEMHPAILGGERVDCLVHDLRAIGFVLKQQLGDCMFLAR